jgi:hypothetical protein
MCVMMEENVRQSAHLLPPSRMLPAPRDDFVSAGKFVYVMAYAIFPAH